MSLVDLGLRVASRENRLRAHHVGLGVVGVVVFIQQSKMATSEPSGRLEEHVCVDVGVAWADSQESFPGVARCVCVGARVYAWSPN